MPDWNAGMPHLRVRRSGGRAVPGQTLERGKGRNRVAASIKEQNCDRQINKIYRDKMAPYLSSFYGTVIRILLGFRSRWMTSLWCACWTAEQTLRKSFSFSLTESRWRRQ